MASEADLPLHGLRVIALEHAVATPFCTRQLADMGADVIKVERPDGGDAARAYDGALNGVSAYFAWLNRGKRSITLDIKRPDDCKALTALVKGADVFVHNLAAGAVERLGLGYENIKHNAPRLIWCGISGYGPDGPHRDRKAYDMLVQAESGVVSVTGSADAPAKVGVSMADISSGLYAYSSILMALLKRERTGAGDRIDISMLECLAEWMMPSIYVWQGTGKVTPRMGVRHNMIVPYGAYACGDGDVVLAVQNDREWRRLCEHVLENVALADDARFVTNERRVANRAVLEGILESRFRKSSRADVLRRLEAADIATAAVNDVPAIARHPQLEARKRWTKVGTEHGEIAALKPPHNIAGIEPRMAAVPALGQHTKDVLTELSKARQ